jgi:hypothetical protein
MEPKSEGCPDAPPGSRANAQQPRTRGCIIHLVRSLSFLYSAHSIITPSLLHVGHQVVHSLGAEFRKEHYNYSLQHSQRNEALNQSFSSKNVGEGDSAAPSGNPMSVVPNYQFLIPPAFPFRKTIIKRRTAKKSI